MRILIRNKARLVTQGHRQEKGIDYEEVFALVARIEAIRLFLAYASFMGFLVYQLDVKSAFLYGTIEEEVYVTQPPGFKDPDHPNKVYKVARYFMVCIKHQEHGLQLQQKEDGIFISQDKYVAEILKKFNYTNVKFSSTPVDLENIVSRLAILGVVIAQEDLNSKFLSSLPLSGTLMLKSTTGLSVFGKQVDILAVQEANCSLLSILSLMLLSIDLVLPVHVPAARRSANQIYYALNALCLSSTHLALKQFGNSKGKHCQCKRQFTTLVDKKRGSSRSSNRSDHHLADVGVLIVCRLLLDFEDSTGGLKTFYKLTFYKALFLHNVLDLEKAKDAQAKEIVGLKKRPPTIPVTTADEGVTAAKIDEITPTSAPTTSKKQKTDENEEVEEDNEAELKNAYVDSPKMMIYI
ncbi:retrovirus-related pol polyprotein from transposon TNT 1-94 [Tanacetum coccineum]